MRWMRILIACQSCQAQYDVTGHAVHDSVHCRCGAAMTVPEPRVHEARLVRCSSCGAVRGSGGNNCEYCDARLSTVDKGWGSMCPGCFCRLPNDAQFCVECGLKICPQKLDSGLSELLCPRCHVRLQGRTLEKIQIEECAGCAGVWLPVSAFESICKDNETLSMATRGLALKRGRRTKFELTLAEAVKYVPCPICRNLMNRRNFSGVSGVIIDTCRDCGVWLDNQELNRIVQFVQAGGLDRARGFEQQNREHATRMKSKGGAGVVLDLPLGEPRHSLLHTRHDEIVPGLVKAVAVLARAFFR